MNYQMQARSSSDGKLYTWTSSAIDFAALGFGGPGFPLDVAISSTPAGGTGSGSSTPTPLSATFFVDKNSTATTANGSQEGPFLSGLSAIVGIVATKNTFLFCAESYANQSVISFPGLLPGAISPELMFQNLSGGAPEQAASGPNETVLPGISVANSYLTVRGLRVVTEGTTVVTCKALYAYDSRFDGAVNSSSIVTAQRSQFIGLVTLVDQLDVTDCIFTRTGSIVSSSATTATFKRCTFTGSAPVIVFSGSTGVVTMDDITRLAFEMGGGTITNGSFSASVLRIADVAAATTGNVTLSGNQTIDGVVNPATVLVWQNNDPTQNGIYNTGSGAWARRSDQSTPFGFRPGTFFAITGGLKYGGSLGALSIGGTVVVGTTAIAYRVTYPDSPTADVFTSSAPGSGTWVKPIGRYSRITIYGISPGGGGGSGRRGAAGTIRGGGGGGAAGAMLAAVFDYAGFATSVTYNCGTPGAGGASRTNVDTDGIAGGTATDATVSDVAQLLLCQGGGGGAGGIAGGAAGGVHAAGQVPGGDGAAADAAGGAGVTGGRAAFNTFAVLGCTGGSSGGGVTTGNVPASGSIGVPQQIAQQSGGGQAGNTTGTNAVPGVRPTAGFTIGGLGGPSGGGSIVTSGSNAAKGQDWGGGGGGGGGGTNAVGTGSGAGARGGDGVWAFFVE